MNIFIRIKAAGKRRDMLEKQARIVPDTITRTEQLIEFLVRENIRAYNAKTVDAPLFKYLSQTELDDGIHTGKVGFGDRKNEQPQNEDAAVQNALQCFADGIYRILINDTETAPGGEFNLHEGDTITFIRLVMLAGRNW